MPDSPEERNAGIWSLPSGGAKEAESAEREGLRFLKLTRRYRKPA